MSIRIRCYVAQAIEVTDKMLPANDVLCVPIIIRFVFVQNLFLLFCSS